MCRHHVELQPHRDRQHRPFSGDRILVNKYAYDFADPERYDVIVFKYPNNGKQNFIKRLVGLPGEGLLIEHGNIYAWDLENESFADRRITRKTPDKLQAMSVVVDDTRFIPDSVREAGWPSLWQDWTAKPGEGWTRSEGGDGPVFRLQASPRTSWLRYRHLKLRDSDWNLVKQGERSPRLANGIPPGELITDYYAYNDTLTTVRFQDGTRRDRRTPNGVHWVGDLGLQAWIDIESDQGTLLLQAVKGGVAFTCSIDVASGQATLNASDDSVRFAGPVSAKTPIRGPGNHRVEFFNADDRLYLWIDGRNIEIENAEYQRQPRTVPVYRKDGPSDSEPLGIGGRDISLQVNRLQVRRDIYYTSKNNTREGAADPSPSLEYTGFRNVDLINEILRNPERWATPQAGELFASRDRDEQWAFRLGPHQLLPMGDNSPQSNDARIWNGERYVDDSYLLGKALFIYWPHAKTTPLPFFPNFERMRFIR